MSKLRSVNTKFWNDEYVEGLDPIEKLLFLYLLTNDATNLLGIYDITLRRIAFDTGIDKDMVVKIFERFEKKNKASYLEGYVMLHNFQKHQKMNKNMKASALKVFEELPEVIKNNHVTKKSIAIMNSENPEPFRMVPNGSTTIPNGSEPFRMVPLSRSRSRSRIEGEEEGADAQNPPLPVSGSVVKPIPGIKPFEDEQLEAQYQRYVNYMKTQHNRIVGIDQQVEQRAFLNKQPDPIEVISQTIRSGYLKLFPVEEGRRTKEDEWNEEIIRRQKQDKMMN